MNAYQVDRLGLKSHTTNNLLRSIPHNQVIHIRPDHVLRSIFESNTNRSSIIHIAADPFTGLN